VMVMAMVEEISSNLQAKRGESGDKLAAVFSEGEEAKRHGTPRDANPYKGTELRRRAWDQGWKSE
jgi:hypothetical protein